MRRAMMACVALLAVAAVGCNGMQKQSCGPGGCGSGGLTGKFFGGGGGGCADGSCTSGGCASGGCTDGCADGSCGGGCADGSCGQKKGLGGLFGKLNSGQMGNRKNLLKENGILGNHHLYGEHFRQPGPPAATVAYPYYTNRGPRDFLMAKPPSIGY